MIKKWISGTLFIRCKINAYQKKSVITFNNQLYTERINNEYNDNNQQQKYTCDLGILFQSFFKLLKSVKIQINMIS